MPIPLPDLDDRRWTDLVEEGRSLIPLLAPEWTDHNASDPGITLMELFAWIAEMDIYRLNRVPDRHKRLFLALLRVRPAPPAAARVVLSFSLAAGSTTPAPIPATAEFTGSNLAGDTVRFASLEAVTVVPAKLDAVQVRGPQGFADVTAKLFRGETVPALGADPVPGAELYLGLQGTLPPNVAASVYLRFAGEAAAFTARQKLLEEGAIPPHHSVRAVWEYLATTGGEDRWLPLHAVDRTRSLTLSGSIAVTPSHAMPATSVGAVARPLRYLRCRFASGIYDAPPMLAGAAMNGVEARQATPLWQTFPIAAGVVASGMAPNPGDARSLRFQLQAGGAISRLDFTGAADDPRFRVLDYRAAGAATAGSLTLEAVVAGQATGEPRLDLALKTRPVLEEGLAVATLEDGAHWRTWVRRDDLAASGRADAHYLLNPTTGALTFGDGEHGLAPPAGSLVLVTGLATLAGTGNVGREQVNRVSDSAHNRSLPGGSTGFGGKLTVANPWPAEGGADAETLAHTIGRAIELREAPLRAVTVPDFENIARTTPGTQVGRATAWANFYPGMNCVKAPGVVTVVVVPHMPGPAPRPSAGLLNRIAARLETRRIVGTRVIVTGPEYLEVKIRATVKCFPGVQSARLRNDVTRRLAEFFHPLTGGPSGTGWPFGRDVYRAEVMQVLDETPGVDRVVSLEMIAGKCPPQCGNLCLGPTWLVASGQHEVEVV